MDPLLIFGYCRRQMSAVELDCNNSADDSPHAVVAAAVAGDWCLYVFSLFPVINWRYHQV